jgi:hypothetical protein
MWVIGAQKVADPPPPSPVVSLEPLVGPRSIGIHLRF